MTLYEIYYHDQWRTIASYGRQAIFTSLEEVEDYLFKNLDDWFNADNDEPILNLIEQVLQKRFDHVTIKTITVHGDETVDFE